MGDAEELSRHVESQVAAYERLHPAYRLFAEVLGLSLTRITRELGLNAIVQVRAKEKASFAEKAVRKRLIYPDAINQMTDLCGGRIITECKDDIEPVLRRLHEYFEILETEDVLDRLGIGEFGYRSIHLIVALKREMAPDALLAEAARRLMGASDGFGEQAGEALFERRPVSAGATADSPTIPRFRAEVQLRTLLQHAWSAIGHDRIYKSEFSVPEKWRRDANRIAAYLEEADESFSRIVKGVESYRGDLGAYMTSEQRQQEFRRLSAVAALDRRNLALALRIARLALSLQDWQGAREILAPFVGQWISEHGAIPQPAMELRGPTSAVTTEEQRTKSSALLAYGLALAGESRMAGHEYVAWAGRLDPSNIDALSALGEAFFESEDYGAAAGVFETAYRQAPDEPRVLARYVCCKLATGVLADALDLIVPSLEAAVARSRERIELRLGLPGSHFDCGMLLLLLRRPSDALKEYIRGASLSSAKDLAREGLILERLQTKTGTQLQGLEWVRRVFVLAIDYWTKGQGEPARDRKYADNAGRPANASPLAQYRSSDLPAVGEPVVIVAGSTAPASESQVRSYAAIFNAAFGGFTGVIVSGGTRAGIAGMVGDLSETEGALRRLAWLPEVLPEGSALHPAYSVHRVPGKEFSPLEPIQGWIALVASGIDPARVKVLGIGGGAIAAVEYRLALMLGASVGIVAGSGGAANDILVDRDWCSAPNLLALPADPRLLNLFVRGIPPATALRDDDREAMARSAHASYRSMQFLKHSSEDPSIADWGQLPEALRASNRNQIDCIEAHLALVGLRLAKVQEETGAVIQFDSGQIERMAENEHARWCLERILSGWRLGDRDVEARSTPYLVPWSELPESMRETNRQAVCAIPAMLQNYGYQIVDANKL